MKNCANKLVFQMNKFLKRQKVLKFIQEEIENLKIYINSKKEIERYLVAQRLRFWGSEGSDLIPGPGTPVCHTHRQKEKKSNCISVKKIPHEEKPKTRWLH